MLTHPPIITDIIGIPIHKINLNPETESRNWNKNNIITTKIIAVGNAAASESALNEVLSGLAITN